MKRVIFSFLLATALFTQIDASATCYLQEAHAALVRTVPHTGYPVRQVGVKRTHEQSETTDSKNTEIPSSPKIDEQDKQEASQELITLRNNYIIAVRMLLVVTSLATKVSFDWEVNGETWNGCWRDWRFYGSSPSEWLIKSTTQSMQTLSSLEAIAEEEILVRLFNLSYGLSLIAATIALPEPEHTAGWRQVVDLYGTTPRQTQSSTAVWPKDIKQITTYGHRLWAARGIKSTPLVAEEVVTAYKNAAYSSEEIDRIMVLMPGFFQATCNLIAKLFYYTADVTAVHKYFIAEFASVFSQRQCLSNQILNGNSVYNCVLVELPKWTKQVTTQARDRVAEERKRIERHDPIASLDDDMQRSIQAVFLETINS